MANKFLNAPEMAGYLLNDSEGARWPVQQLVTEGLRAADVRDTAITGNLYERKPVCRDRACLGQRRCLEPVDDRKQPSGRVERHSK